jgi:[glutamine synthetase] adenylyltransferase / [glutamine synthetase]-adenylyl-L-tyrosine phosphorylase
VEDKAENRRVGTAERLLDEVPGAPALARLRRARFAEPERAARELRLLAGDPHVGRLVRGQLAPLLGALERVPDPDAALVGLERFVRRDAGATFAALAPRGRAAVEPLLWALGGTPFLAEQVIRHPEWASWLAKPGVLQRATSATSVASEARRLAGGRGQTEARAALRLLRRREIVRVAVRDLQRLATVDETLSALSALADGLVQVALEVAAAGDDGLAARPPREVPGFAVLALGKLGGRELNFSSDVDLVYVHRGGAGEAAAAEVRAQSLARRLTAVLGDTTEDGHVYRVDLRLRPEGRAGSISHSLEAAAEYYGWRGATWERLALLKARTVAGERALGRSVLEHASAFVWRQPFGADAVREVLRHKQESDRRLAARRLQARHVKLGRGGIREIELLVQVLQIRAGGKLRHPAARATLGALAGLVEAGALPARQAQRLERAYLFLRDVENKLQMTHDAQTHVLPDDDAEVARLAARLGYRRRGAHGAAARFQADFARHADAVHELYAGLLGGLVTTGSGP